MDQMMASLPQMLDEVEVSRVLGVSIAALRRWRREKRGPEFTHLERCVRYSTKSIEWWIAENSSRKNNSDPRTEGA